MPYYEFYNIPGAPPAYINEVAGRGVEQGNPFRELAAADDLQISVSISANTSPRGWIGTGPDYVRCMIRRRVKTHQNQAAALARNISPGQLLLYQIAVMSCSEDWRCGADDAARWPKAFMEMDVQAGPRLRFDLERLVVDSWLLEASTEGAGEVFETLMFRAWVVRQAVPAGNVMDMVLGNSP